MSKPKRYRRKRNRFELVETRFDSLEAGPVVVLKPNDFDVEEVSFAEFNEDFEEVPEGEGKDEFSKVTEWADRVIRGLPASEMISVSVREIRAILDAARKSLAGGDAAVPESAERCRVGEWVPGRYLEHLGYGQAFCYMDETQGCNVRVVVLKRSGDPFKALVGKEGWDAARARWIADGRPTS